ncbi:MAG: hypothetical protein AAGE76_14355 [Pseudomonadota bacterium]
MANAAERFIQSLADPLLDGDFETTLAAYETPVVLIRPHEDKRVFEREEFIEEMRVVRQAHLDRGLVAIRASQLSTRSYAPGLLMVDVCWHYLDARVRDLGRLYATYILRPRGDEDFRISVHISHNEIYERQRAA